MKLKELRIIQAVGVLFIAVCAGFLLSNEIYLAFFFWGAGFLTSIGALILSLGKEE